MTDERLKDLLRSAVPPMAGQRPPRDLWPLVVNRIQARATWSWIDISLTAGVVIVLLIFPKALLQLSFHL
jgi:hypothetical protein